jgi:hypothetical protein
MFGSTAIATGELFWEIDYEGKSSALERTFTFTFTRDENQWQIVAQHIGRTPPKKN